MGRFSLLGLFVVLAWGALVSEGVRAEGRPNVIVIMSDDQGVGDYGFMGNDVIKTPHIDEMFAASGYLSNFYVSPVCAPTRASLMTGRYNYRTRCIDTFLGRAMMDSEEVTMAEMLRDAGYRTGIFGKWHLGDNYPLRAMDQGFEESLVHRGGGIGQPSDPIGAEGKYTDPTLFRNGEEVAMSGYCTDIFFDGAIEFIERAVSKDERFFAYIAPNAPHGPFHDVPKQLYDQYRNGDFSPIMVRPLEGKRLAAESDKLARIAAMITNIDENVGKLRSKLETLGVADNTIVIYLNDNGPNSARFVGEMRGMKTEVDDGGIRSPLLFHWPARVEGRKTSDALCAHIDVLPTILEACEISPPAEPSLDGRSFLPLLIGTNTQWPTRHVVIQTHRGDKPEFMHHFAIHEDPWKLVHPSGFGKETFEGEPRLELYHLRNDPRQQHNLIEQHPEVVERLRLAYEDWIQDVSMTRQDNFAPPRIVIGTPHEVETVLTRQDWRHSQGAPWGKGSNGYWLLESQEAAEFDVELIFATEDHPKAVATVSAGELTQEVTVAAGERRGQMATMMLPAGQFRLAVEVEFSGAVEGPHQVILTRR
ncbi:arylsulfatase [Rhodopirellula sp. SWK7]|uniref:arylsulfatase n=1 Tax=Rhodopirellula sp. SWK7 TaxID=595460 RepID=UPI0002BE889F|nr:arylsulfatase [Rhodopirellula sp. SWK7]EMI43230.1 arylsulfatase [Rhodopirellula sp. SWK7]